MKRYRLLWLRKNIRDDAADDKHRTVLDYEPPGGEVSGDDEPPGHWKRVLLDFVTHFVVEALLILVGVVLVVWFLGWIG